MKNLGTMGFSEAQADLLDVATNFCRQKSPIETVRRLIESDVGFDASVWREVAELGWLGIAVPEDLGGVGLGLGEAVPVMEQMGRNLMAGPYLSTTLAAQALIKAGTDEQKAAVLPKMVAGSPAALAFAEESGAWDLSKAQARATADGGDLVLEGTKLFVCDADAAEWLLVSARVDGRPALVLVERACLGEGAMRRETVIDETKRSYTVNLDGARVPMSALLDQSHTEEALKHLHLAACLLSAAEQCGGTLSVIEYTNEYLGTRKQFGRLIGSYQALKHPMVDAYCNYEQARSHLYAAAHCFGDPETGEIATRMAKVTADTALAFASDRAIQFHGGFGFSYDCDAQLYRRRAIWHAAQYGDAAYHKKRLADLIL